MILQLGYHLPSIRSIQIITIFAQRLMERLPEDDPIFEDPTGVIALLHYGVQFYPEFISRIKDPAKIGEYFPLLKNTIRSWIYAFPTCTGSLVMLEI